MGFQHNSDQFRKCVLVAEKPKVMAACGRTLGFARDLNVDVCVTDADAEQPRRRKLSRRHSAPAAAAPINNQASDVSDSVPPVVSNLMMVEVENVGHDPYKTTEEMKVFM